MFDLFDPNCMMHCAPVQGCCERSAHLPVQACTTKQTSFRLFAWHVDWSHVSTNQSAARSHEGAYECVVSNAIGVATVTVQIDVQCEYSCGKIPLRLRVCVCLVYVLCLSVF